jgi:steroid delta-isomerase-like uncharacterized protein
MTAEDAREFAGRWRAAWNSRRPDEVLSLCADGVSWDDPLTAGPQRGPAAVRGYLEGLWTASPDLELEWAEAPLCSLDAARLACRWHMTGTMSGPLDPPGFAPTGRRLDAEGVDVFQLGDGLVQGYKGFFDARAMAQQLGLLPGTGSAGERVAVAAQRLAAGVGRRLR